MRRNYMSWKIIWVEIIWIEIIWVGIIWVGIIWVEFIWNVTDPLVDIIGIKPAHGDHEFNFKKVSTIKYGCNTNWTQKNSIHIRHIFLKIQPHKIVNLCKVQKAPNLN